MIPEKITYNLHYDDVPGDFLRPYTVQHQLHKSKIKVKITKIGESVGLSLFARLLSIALCYFVLVFFFSPFSIMITWGGES